MKFNLVDKVKRPACLKVELSVGDPAALNVNSNKVQGLHAINI